MKGARRTTAACHDVDENFLDESVSLDFDTISDFAKNDLALAALEAITRFLQRPDAQAMLDKERELLLREGSTLLHPRPKNRKEQNNNEIWTNSTGIGD